MGQNRCQKKMSTNVLVGVERSFIKDIKEEIAEKANIGADYFVAPLFHPRFRRDADGTSASRLGAVTRSDRELESRQWISNIVGKISEWIDLDSTDPSVRKSSLQALQQETAWAAHLALQAILIPPPRIYSTNYARSMLEAFTGYQQIYVRIPMIPQLSMHYQFQSTTVESSGEYCKDGWLVWDGFRQNLGDFSRFFVALELTKECEDIDLESTDGSALVRRWCAEPVKVIILPVALFLANNAGFPVLSKQIQQILRILLPHCGQILLSGQSQCDDQSYTHYAQYIRHLKSRDVAAMSEAEKYVLGYEDILQAPLQPLFDNLEAQTYETFERDPTKYIQYEKAITKALVLLYEKRQLEHSFAGLPATATHTTSNNKNNTNTVTETETETAVDTPRAVTLVLTVVGAGRGPLVAAALSASSATNIPVRVYAVEKNANAVITLRNRALTEFWSNVQIVSTDMRDWQPVELCDLMISELLGSFGDNELSPECLDGAQKCLKPDGISIPHNYTSFIAPVATSKLWNMAKGFNSSNSTISNGMDTAYVVRFKSAFLFAPAQDLFVFEHPHRPTGGGKIDNTRYEQRSFVSETDMVMHGIAGYFESVLFSKALLQQRDLGSDLQGVSVSEKYDFTPTSPRSPRAPTVAQASRNEGSFRPPSPQVSVPPPPPGMSQSSTSSATSLTLPQAQVLESVCRVEQGNPQMAVDPPASPAGVSVAGPSTLLNAPSLEDTVMLSIVPHTHTEGMFSWFPLFIPLAQPIRVKKGETITVHIWRCADARKVWYEWCLSSPVRTPVQNSGGKAYSVGL